MTMHKNTAAKNSIASINSQQKKDLHPLEKIKNELHSNHLAMMSICCILPVIIIIVLGLFGLTGFWVYTLAIVACVGSHIGMMFMGSKGGKSCH